MVTGAVVQTLTLFVVSCVVLTSGRHDEGVVNINSGHGRYKLQAHVNMVTWMQAKVVCEHEGGVLFHPRDQYEANQAKLFWDREVFSHNTGVFVGLNDLKRKGYFETIEGEPSTAVYNNWHSGEPNDVDGNEDCAILVRDALYDYHCHWRLPFICRQKFEDSSEDRFYSDLLTSTPPTTEVESDDRFYSDLLTATPPTTEYESIVTMSTIATVDEKSEQTVTSGAQGLKTCSYYLMFVTWAVVCNLLGR